MIILEKCISKQDIQESFFQKLKDKDISYKEAAQGMYLAQSTLSMWKAKRAIPDSQLPNAANFLKDAEFSAQVSNYYFGLPTIPEDKTIRNDALSLWVHLVNVEKKKSSIGENLEEVLDHNTFDQNQRHVVISACQMMRAEAGIENHLANILVDKYDITDKELHPQISKFAKDRKRIVEREINRMASN